MLFLILISRTFFFSPIQISPFPIPNAWNVHVKDKKSPSYVLFSYLFYIAFDVFQQYLELLAKGR
jgi:hypothetical protein